MKLALILAILFPLTLLSAPLKSLDDLEWNHRILVIRADESEVEALQAELALEEEGIVDRDMVWFIRTPDRMISNYPGAVSEDFSVDPMMERIRYRRAALIGKDGLVKSFYPRLNLEAVFSLIDSMPMRRAEMRRNNP